MKIWRRVGQVRDAIMAARTSYVPIATLLASILAPQAVKSPSISNCYGVSEAGQSKLSFAKRGDELYREVDITLKDGRKIPKSHHEIDSRRKYRNCTATYRIELTCDYQKHPCVHVTWEILTQSLPHKAP